MEGGNLVRTPWKIWNYFLDNVALCLLIVIYICCGGQVKLGSIHFNAQVQSCCLRYSVCISGVRLSVIFYSTQILGILAIILFIQKGLETITVQ